MTIQEIRDLIAKKIAGQGTMVDVGNGLSAILNGILDEMAAIPAPKEEVVIDLTDYPVASNTIALPTEVYNQICEALKTKVVFVKTKPLGDNISIVKSMIVAFIDLNGVPDNPISFVASSGIYRIMLD